jgi:hypothetical protein
MRLRKGKRVRALREVGNFWSGYVRRDTEGTVVEINESFWGAITYKVRFPHQTVDYLTEEDVMRAGSW